MFAKSLEISPTTVNHYLDHLKGAFIIRKLQPWHFNSRKRLTKTPKVYIRDSGILHYLLDIPDQQVLIHHPQIGHSWEGYVVEEICRKLDHRLMPYFYRTHDGSEIDLVLVKGIKPFASIEVKYSTTPSTTKSMTEGIKELKTTNNYMIVPGDEPSWPLSDRIIVTGLREFLGRILPRLAS
jgi:predicted AAA+ superfamily ATPase